MESSAKKDENEISNDTIPAKAKQSTNKEKKVNNKAKKFKEEICQEDPRPQEEQPRPTEIHVKTKNMAATPSKSPIKVKSGRSPTKTRLPMLEQRRRRVMNKLIEIDTNCTHRPSANDESDDVIFITEDMHSQADMLATSLSEKVR